MKKYKVELDVKGVDQLEKVNEELDNIETGTEKVKEGSAEMGGALDKATGGMVSKFKSLKDGIMSSVRGFGLMKTAIAATGIGLLLLAFSSLKAAFTSTEEGQNKFNKMMNALGVITGNLVDILASLGNKIISVFEDPKKAIEDFKNLIIENVENRINAVIKLFGFLGSAVKKVFSGDFAGAMDDAKAAGSALVDVTTGVENTLEKVAGAIEKVVEETKKEIAVSNQLSDLEARNAKLTRKQLTERARLESEIADLRLKAEQADQYSFAEREAALRRALELNDTIFAREEEIAQNALKIQRERNKMSGSTAEDLYKEAQLEANLILLQKQRANASKEMTTKIVGLSNQRKTQLQKEHDKSATYQQSLIDKEKAKNDATLKMFKDHLTEKEKAAKEADEKRAEAEEEASQKRAKNLAGLRDSALAGLQVASSFIKMLAEEVDTNTREGFEKNKKLRLAGIVADTLAAGIAGMLAGLSAGGPWGIALGAITAASALAFGGLQYKKLKQSTFDGGGSPSGESVPKVNTAAPSSSLITPLSSDAANAAIATPPPTKAYVVSSDVSTGIALDRNAASTANF